MLYAQKKFYKSGPGISVCSEFAIINKSSVIYDVDTINIVMVKFEASLA